MTIDSVSPAPAVPVARSVPNRVAVDLYWLPLGAGGHFVRFNGRIYEALAARAAHRPACDLYHSALEVRVPDGRFVIEMTPVRGGDRGAVAEGPVGSRWAGRRRLFRYEIRRWRDGVIPDLAEAVGGPRRLSEDEARARRVLDLVPQVPTLVWGRDQLGAGEMWNSNSVVSWLLARAGIDAAPIRPPAGGRAPGWRAGVLAADRNDTTEVMMSRTRPLTRSLAEGAIFQLIFATLAFAALAVWARICGASKHR